MGKSWAKQDTDMELCEGRFSELSSQKSSRHGKENPK